MLKPQGTKCQCKSCEVPFYKKMLHRTNPLGVIPADWMCIDCIEKEEPELYKNIKSDDYQTLKDIEWACFNKNKK